MDILLCFLFPSSHAGEVRINDTGLVTGILLTFRRLEGLVGLSIPMLHEIQQLPLKFSRHH
jgi:hypothetical protein